MTIIRLFISGTSYQRIVFLSHLENCLYGEWNQWTSCNSETAIKYHGYRLCGIGGKERTRDFKEIAISNGTSCADESKKYQECQLDKEATNCKFICIIKDSSAFWKELYYPIQINLMSKSIIYQALVLRQGWKYDQIPFSRRTWF